VQPQLVLLQKTLLNIEGLGRQLYPDLDLWKTAKPFLEKWMEEQVGARAMLRHLKEDMPYMIEKLPELPGLVYKSLKAYADGEYHIKQVKEIEKIRKELSQNHHSSMLVLSGSSMLVASSVVYSLAGAVPLLLGAPVLSWVFGATGVVFVAYGLRK